MNVGGFRALSWARRFHDKGHDVTVIHGDGQEAESCAYFPETLDRDLKTIRIHNPLLGEAGGPTERVLPAGKRAKIIREALSQAKALARRAIPVLDTFWLWGRRAIKAARQELRVSGPFDVVMSTSFPLSAHTVARALALGERTVWIADFRDFYGQFDSNSIPKKGARERLIRSFLKTIGSEADIVTTVSARLGDLVEAGLHPRRVEVINNGYFIEHIESFSEGAPLRRIFYAGSFNAIEFTLEPLVSALKILRDRGTEIPPIVFSGARIGKVADSLEGAGLKVEFIGALSNRESLREQRNSAVLLLCDAMSGPGALLTKTFEYLACRRPILVIARPESELATTVFSRQAHGYLLSLNPEKIAEFLEENLDNRGERDSDFYETSFVESYSRERQADRLLGLIEDARKVS